MVQVQSIVPRLDCYFWWVLITLFCAQQFIDKRNLNSIIWTKGFMVCKSDNVIELSHNLEKHSTLHDKKRLDYFCRQNNMNKLKRKGCSNKKSKLFY